VSSLPFPPFLSDCGRRSCNITGLKGTTPLTDGVRFELRALSVPAQTSPDRTDASTGWEWHLGTTQSLQGAHAGTWPLRAEQKQDCQRQAQFILNLIHPIMGLSEFSREGSGWLPADRGRLCLP